MLLDRNSRLRCGHKISRSNVQAPNPGALDLVNPAGRRIGGTHRREGQGMVRCRARQQTGSVHLHLRRIRWPPHQVVELNCRPASTCALRAVGPAVCGGPFFTGGRQFQPHADFDNCPNSLILRSSTFTAAVATFSSRWLTREVPGIGSMTGERHNSHASAN
jgi:hypothetical protein